MEPQTEVPTTVPTTATTTVSATAPTTVPTTAPTTVSATAPTTAPMTVPTTVPLTEPEMELQTTNDTFTKKCGWMCFDLPLRHGRSFKTRKQSKPKPRLTVLNGKNLNFNFDHNVTKRIPDSKSIESDRVNTKTPKVSLSFDLKCYENKHFFKKFKFQAKSTPIELEKRTKTTQASRSLNNGLNVRPFQILHNIQYLHNFLFLIIAL